MRKDIPSRYFRHGPAEMLLSASSCLKHFGILPQPGRIEDRYESHPGEADWWSGSYGIG